MKDIYSAAYLTESSHIVLLASRDKMDRVFFTIIESFQ